MTLTILNKGHFNSILKNHEDEGGHHLNVSLSKLFTKLDDEENKHEVSIKVAALNTLYSTSITYIKPVVDEIVKNIDNSHNGCAISEYVNLVDKIATVEWTNEATNKKHKRCNLSFSSKYVHFLSNKKTPIYDSYIWIVMIGYLNQSTDESCSFNAPESYSNFFETFCLFKSHFKLEEHGNYMIDKFLWQYGKELIFSIMESEGVTLDKAKSLLKKRIISG